MRLSSIIALRPRHGRLICLISFIATLVVVAYTSWLATVTFTAEERGNQLMGQASTILRVQDRVATVAGVDAQTKQLQDLIPDAQIVPRFQVSREIAGFTDPRDVSVSVFPFTDQLVKGLVEWEEPYPPVDSDVAVSAALAEALGISVGDPLELCGIPLNVDTVFAFPALPAQQEIWLSPELVARTWGSDLQVDTVAWYVSEVSQPTGEILFAAGYRQMPRDVAVASSEFPDPELSFGSVEIIVCAGLVLLVSLIMLGRLDRREFQSLIALGMNRTKCLRVATGVYFIRVAFGLAGIVAGWGVARVALTGTTHISGLKYGSFTLDPVALIAWLLILVAASPAYVVSQLWKPRVFHGYKRLSRAGVRWPWWLRIPLRDYANERALTLFTFVGLTTIVALTVCSLTLLNMSEIQRSILSDIPRPSDSTVRIDIGDATVPPTVLASIGDDQDVEVTQLFWGSFPQRSELIDNVVLNTPTIECSKEAYALAESTGTFDRRHCLKGTQDLLPDKLVALASADDVEALIGRAMSTSELAAYENGVACVGVSCPAEVELTSLSASAPTVNVPATTLDVPSLGLGMPQILMNSDLAATLGIEGNGAPPLPDGTLFTAPFSDHSLVVSSNAGEPDVPAIMQDLRDSGVDAPRAEEPVEAAVESTQTQFRLASLVFVVLTALFFGLIARARALRLDGAVHRLNLLGASWMELRIWIAASLLVDAVAPWLIGTLVGLAVTCQFLRANDLEAYFAFSPFILVAILVAVIGILMNAHKVGRRPQTR